jgi:dephospho-CoA kinase
MKIIGLTGGIASGKSTVTKTLRELGAKVIDADALAREVVSPGTAGLEEVLERFPDVRAADGSLDRPALARRVFADAADREALHSILGPRIRDAFEQQARALEASGNTVCIYDAALLIETGTHEQMDAVIVVKVPSAVQKNRLMLRNNLTSEQADQRIAAQMPLEEKLKYATYVIDNAGTLEETRRQVERIWASINEMPL